MGSDLITMRRLLFLAILAALVFVAAPAMPGDGGRTIDGRVSSVTDGDTLRVRASEGDRREYRVRLIGIDTPETNRPNTPVECGARAASAFMARLASRRRVVLRTDPSQDAFDRYGRLLAYVTIRGDRRTAEEHILEAGWAEVYVYDGVPFERVRRFRAAQRRARAADRGVWGRCGGDFHRPA